MPIPRAVAVVLDGPRVLVIKRFRRDPGFASCNLCREAAAPGPLCPGHRYAVLPGGHVEEGESAETAALRELTEETTLTGRIERLLWTGRHGARPASYFLMTGVTGTSVLAGEEAVEHRPDNSFELAWATTADFERLNLVPSELRGPLAALLDAR
ncbi:NUDIX domain-containing protein [Actinomadura sp. ATCC 31491]|uniref:NUDIX domain-containing protein n=1 Tax=Actinomadura luzonensis TaxID=2805427 RepID=A0ABT0GAB8_9ACTN|nr:NUDIX domain-containing protein [Actinomadura luzonensis]MCK2221554.1 NUDIX domain-containing protein [Actinomadura luzonensis]